VRYLAAKHKSTVLEPADLKTRALASKWMDWQLSVCGPAITPVFWGLIRTPPEKRDHAAIETGKKTTTASFVMADEQLGKTEYLAGSAFSYGDIPVGVMAYRYRQLVPDRPPLKNFERWYAAISSRKAFKDQVGSVPLS
jgi:glutathione S-transferase